MARCLLWYLFTAVKSAECIVIKQEPCKTEWLCIKWLDEIALITKECINDWHFFNVSVNSRCHDDGVTSAPVFCLWLVKVSATERIHYICNVVCHWLRSCSAMVGKLQINISKSRVAIKLPQWFDLKSQASHCSFAVTVVLNAKFEMIGQGQIDGLVHDSSNSSALAMELLQYGTKPSKWKWCFVWMRIHKHWA